MTNFYCRLCYATQLSLSLLALSLAYYLEYYEGFLPCALCLLERYLLILLCGLYALSYLLLSCAKRTQKIFCLINLSLCVLGLLLAGLHSWIQSRPLELMHTCSSKLHALLPTLQSLFVNTPDCALVEITFLGLTLAHGSFLLFAVLAGISMWLYWIVLKNYKKL
jgi:protein dithiol:quinone oxidoreductase